MNFQHDRCSQPSIRRWRCGRRRYAQDNETARRLIQWRLRRSGWPPEHARRHIKLRKSLSFAGVGLNGISSIDDGVLLDEKRITAQVPVIMEVHAGQPAPALDGMDPA